MASRYVSKRPGTTESRALIGTLGRRFWVRQFAGGRIDPLNTPLPTSADCLTSINLCPNAYALHASRVSGRNRSVVSPHERRTDVSRFVQICVAHRERTNLGGRSCAPSKLELRQEVDQHAHCMIRYRLILAIKPLLTDAHSQVSLYTFVSPLASSMMAPGLEDIATHYGITNAAILAMTLSIFLLAYALGPLFLAPLSEVSRRSRIQTSLYLLTVVGWRCMVENG